MIKKIHGFHILLLTIEFATLVAAFFLWVKPPEPNVVPVGSPFWPLATLSAGIGMVLATLTLRYGVGRSLPHQNILSVFVGGVIMIGIGVYLSICTFPTLLRSSHVANAVERWEKMGALVVTLDANGGLCGDIWRIVKSNRGYGDVINVYSGEDCRCMQLHAAKLDLNRGWIVVDLNNESLSDKFINFFASNSIPINVTSLKWTYVVDIAEKEGAFSYWTIGQTMPTNHNVYAQLSCGFVRPTIKEGEKQFLILDSTKWGEKCNMLDRAYIHLRPGQRLKAKFRVSLFAGTGVSESNYHYVKPGETIACPLPVPTREGYVFEGWYDGERRITDESKVEKCEPHTLKARWRKL